ncbi:hypothetical protein V8B97DRAFT_1967055 [Scleroderma yunnanense]
MLMVVRSKCTYSQFQQIATALFGTLDTEYLHSTRKALEANDPNGYPDQQALALRGLSCIFVPWICQDRQEHHRKQSISMFTSHWIIIHRWITYLKTDYVDNANVDITFRIAAKRSIVDILGLAGHQSLSDFLPMVFNSPRIADTLFSLWRLEIQDRRFNYSTVLPDEIPGIYSIPAILDNWQAHFVGTVNWNWDELLRNFDNDGALLAFVALAHLRHDMAQFPMNYDRIICDIHLLTVFSLKDTICMPMLKHGSLPTIMSLMLFLVRGQYPPNVHHLVAKALSYACWYIRGYVDSADGIPWVTQVIEGGILQLMLLAEPLTKYLPGEVNWEPLYDLFREVIPRYSIYRSVLKLILKHHKEIEDAGLPERLETDTSLWVSWSTFDDEIEWKAQILDADEDVLHLHTCQNIKCGKTSSAGTFRQCAGCLYFYYCTKECQTYDWKHGGHKAYCRSIQARRTVGETVYPSASDLRFFDNIIHHDLTWNAKAIHEVAATHPDSPVAIQLDYSFGAVVPTIAPASTIGPPPICQCESMVHQRWSLMLELARRAKTPRVLIRALIPCGTSPKIKLLVIPLSRIASDSDSGHEEVYEGEDVDNTFDHFYECIKKQPGFMDGVFPEPNSE